VIPAVSKIDWSRPPRRYKHWYERPLAFEPEQDRVFAKPKPKRKKPRKSKKPEASTPLLHWVKATPAEAQSWFKGPSAKNPRKRHVKTDGTPTP